MFSVFIRVEMIFLLAFKTWWNFVVSFRHPFILIFLWSLHDFALSLSLSLFGLSLVAVLCRSLLAGRHHPLPAAASVSREVFCQIDERERGAFSFVWFSIAYTSNWSKVYIL
ncbi:hypothetical protein GLYMA_08G029150v4 [Glycine max]|nr:hypothetical protein GLYMA_08G029150v4 [Glycine max]KAH1049381.1 hypothetical protein GYH30_020068 [Glycine max]